MVNKFNQHNYWMRHFTFFKIKDNRFPFQCQNFLQIFWWIDIILKFITYTPALSIWVYWTTVHSALWFRNIIININYSAVLSYAGMAAWITATPSSAPSCYCYHYASSKTPSKFVPLNPWFSKLTWLCNIFYIIMHQ